MVIERKQAFAARMAHLWVMTGERPDPAQGARDLSDLTKTGIEIVRAEIETIEPETRTVHTTAGTLTGDQLVIALGAETNPNGVPGLADAAFDLYDQRGALQLQRALAEFSGGRIVVLISRTSFSCPSAPYEAAFLIDSLLRERGVRDQTEIALYTPEDRPMLVAGDQIGAALIEMLEEREIELHWEQLPMKIDPAAKRILFEVEDTNFDLLVGVPPHVAPESVRACGLVDAFGWVPVDPSTLETPVPGVFAIGEVTAIRLANGMFLPKAGAFADRQARVVAENIAAEINGGAGGATFNGTGFCYIEVGGGVAAYGSGNFYGTPAPQITMEGPSQHFRQEKGEQEQALLALWD